MTFEVKKLFSAVRMALSIGAVITGGMSTAFAQETSQAAPSNAQNAQTLQAVMVTGSHIRRVDTETSSPVITIDRQQIEASGTATLAELIQQLPAVTGGNVNQQVNNAGTGRSSIGLRGLGPDRTLILLDGQRIETPDPSTIPTSMIERIDVLTDGASAIYGSDAIGGVVNIITRKNFQGAEFALNYGESSRSDGKSKGYAFTFGQTSDQGSIMGGIQYNDQQEVSAANRDFSKNAVSLVGNANTPPFASVGGSSSSQYGHIQVPKDMMGAFPGCGQNFVARNPGAAGLTFDTDNFHCFQNAGANTDKYNYAPLNLDLVPLERTSGFLNGTYKLSDHISAYGSYYHTKMTSVSILAPAGFGSSTTKTISADNYWNPAGSRVRGAGNGVQYGGKAGLNSVVRTSSLGSRFASTARNIDQVNTGLEGDFDILDRNWQWNVGLGYGHVSLLSTKGGSLDNNKLYTGPSFLDPATGNVTCGYLGAPVGNCDASFNPFNLFTAGSAAALKIAGAPVLGSQYAQQKVWHGDMNGSLFDLPAGTVQLAVGGIYRQEHIRTVVSPLNEIDVATATCAVGSCSASLAGGFNVKELYAEVLIPVVKDLPFVHSLNVTIGDRYSRFSTFGSTNNKKFAVEWMPIRDLMLRGTVAEVFRAPNIPEVFSPPTGLSYHLANDVCQGYTGSPVLPTCVDVPTNGTFVNQAVQDNSQVRIGNSGSQYAGLKLKPEQGKSFDIGAVYNPSWAPGLSATVDVWHLNMSDIITVLGLQNTLDLCAAGQDQFCQYIHRVTGGPNQGQILGTTLGPTANLGSLKVGGVDGSLHYRVPEFGLGQFIVNLDASYMSYYDQETSPNTDANVTYHVAGHYLPYGSAQAAGCPGTVAGCLFPRIRAQSALDWHMDGWNASWRTRFISSFQMGSKSPSQDVFPAGPKVPLYVVKYGSTIYHDISAGYNFKTWHTRLDFGVKNLFDKQPPFLYANNSLNANTSPSDFDLVGRYFWGRMTFSF
ncbi:MAG: TonB-dependent receptor [Rhodanobacter sp.]